MTTSNNARRRIGVLTLKDYRLGAIDTSGYGELDRLHE
jgi:hypothetical protein